MDNRLQLLEQKLQKHDLDAVLITLPKHVYYFTGFESDPHERLLAFVLVKGQEPFLLVPALDEKAATNASSVTCIYTHTDTQSAYEVLKGLLPKSINKLGIEGDYETYSRCELIRQVIMPKELVSIDAELRSIRLVKTEKEIQLMKHAVLVVEEVLRRGLEYVREGVTELDLVAELEYQMKKCGASGPSFSTLVLTGENAALPHGNPSNRQVKQGDLLLFDLGVYVNGYASDITRTFAIGDITEEQKFIYNTVLQSNLAAIEATKPGVKLKDLDQISRDVIQKAGYGEYFVYRLGHGLGLDVHEYPSVHGANEDLLVEGMTFTIEPGIYVSNVAGVRIEDDVLVTKDGVEVLTTFPKTLTTLHL